MDFTNQRMKRTTSMIMLVVFLCVTFLSGITPAFAAASPEEALRELNIHIIADKATPIKCMLYNGKAKNGYFAYFQGQNRNGVTNNYPCYCVIPDQLGVNNLGDRDAELTQTVQSPKIYGAIMNGYPYKQPEELGLTTNKEAYYATRNVVWTLAGNWDYSLWKSDGTEQGERVKAAMDQIYKAAQNWQSIPVELECKLTSSGEAAEKDGYVEQTYTITANYSAAHSVQVLLKNAPSSAKITDLNHQEKTTFAVGDDFKVRVPKADAANADFDVTLYVQAQDYAVYYAKTAQSDCQDYYATYDPINTSVSDATFTYGETTTPDQPVTPEEPEKPVVEDGKVTVYKKDNNNQPLAGAVFRVLKDGAEIGSFGTDSQGKFSFPIDANTYIKAELPDPHDGTYIEHYEPLENGTPYQTYSVIEVEAPYGYLISKDANQTITTIANGEGGLVQDSFTVSFVNEPYGNLLIEKTDQDTNQYLAGAVFRVTYLPGANDTYSFTTDVTTDGTGMASITKLKPGSYSIQEIEAPEHYILDSKKETVTVTSGETTTYHGVNGHKPGISIYKYDPNNDIPLAGAAFKIEGIDNDFSGSYQTDERGRITVEDLPAGSYQVTETKAPAGYVISGENPKVVELSPGQLSAQLVFENQKKAELEITKLDQDTGKSIAGTTFQIRGIDSTYNQDFVTDDNGKIRLENLIPGSYEITETIAAPGYELNPENRKSVELEAGGTVQLVFYNQKFAVLEILKQEKVSKKPIPGVIFTITEKGGAKVDDDTTDAAGKITLTNLETGWYTITEKSVPDGVILNTASKDVYLEKGKTSSVVFENSIKPVLQIEKLDSVTKDVLSGAKFQVWYAENGSSVGNLQELGTFTTGTDGRIDLGQVEVGWYRIKEVAAPSGYELAGVSSKDVFMQADKDQTITFENMPKSAIVIKKVDADTGKPLEGAYFRVRFLGGTSGTGGTTIGEYVTSSNGTAVITGLKAGTYVIEELSAPDGYVINDGAKTVYLSGQEQDVVTVVFGDDKMGSLLIVKKDAVTGTPLSDVEFLVTNSDGGVIGSANGKYVTDSAGTIRIDNLEPGLTVIVKESRAKEGYILDDTPQSIKIKANETMTLEFRNQPKTQLLIVKKDAVTGEPLAGVEFRVTDSNDGVIGASDGLFVTDSAGTIHISGLTPGMSVIAREIRAKDGYVLDDTPKTIKIQAGEVNTLEFLNQPKTQLLIVKKDAVTGEPLAGVEFRVTDSNDGVIGTSDGLFVTDSAGTIHISGLTPGVSVIARETRAKDGYVLDDTPKTIQIKANTVNTMEFLNQPKGGLVIVKKDAVTGKALKGVEFKITASDGTFVPDAEGAISSNGLYYTDENGQITLSKLPPDTYVVTETKTIDGYVLDTTPQTVRVNTNDTQTLTFTNQPVGGLTIIKKDAETGKRIEGVQFEVQKMNGEVVGQYTTDRNGTIQLPELEKGWYRVTELKAAKGYLADTTPQQIEVKDGEIATLEMTNKKAASILIHKIDAGSKDGIYGVKFLLYDGNRNPIGQYESDQDGYVYINENLTAGKYYLRELEAAEGYILDETVKTVYVSAGKTTEITWENTGNRGQIQIIKKSAADNSMNGLAKGTLLAGAVFEIRAYKTGTVVDTIKTDHSGRAVSKTLPLGRYLVKEIQAPDYYGVNPNEIDCTLEFNHQILRYEVTDEPLETGVSITKRGYYQVMAGGDIEYTFSDIANDSNVALESFYWKDTLSKDFRIQTIQTGTYNQKQTYKIVYRTNLNSTYRSIADNLSTKKNYVKNVSPLALGLAANEYVTEIMFVFGTVQPGFAQVEQPKITVTVNRAISNPAGVVNMAEAGGLYQGEWIQAVDRWVTTVYQPLPVKLPRTGY